MNRPKADGNRRLLCYYGDDFTGSTDVLEALFSFGLETVLFLEPPSPELLADKFQDVDCFGVAGVGRSLTPTEMEEELRPILATLKTAGTAIVHYKICSTFDSSPSVGSIGKAAEIGKELFRGRFIPLLVGVPYLQRYTLFGHHFASAGSQVYRLDRHPTMSRHPATPMTEADLAKHLQQQARLKTGSMNITQLTGSSQEIEERLEKTLSDENPDLLLFDVLDEQRLRDAGELIWKEALRSRESLFVVGSSGVEYALGGCWREQGLLPKIGAGERSWKPVDRLLVVSGSCSPMTEKQIVAAERDGFACIRVPFAEWLRAQTADDAMEHLREDVLRLLDQGRSVVLYSALGPRDDSIRDIRDGLLPEGKGAESSSRLLGKMLGRLAREVALQTKLPRLLIAGGDTSGYVTRELGVYALSCKAQLEPGVPLCNGYSNDDQLDGVELVLKGGQMGSEHFFEKVLRGESI